MIKRYWLAYRVLIVIMAGNLTGCSVILPFGMQKKTISSTTERQRTDLNKKDLKLTFTPTSTGDGISFRLQYQPYYQEKYRSITRYKWDLDDSAGLLGIGLIELGFAALALFPDKVGQDDPKFREFLIKYQEPILIGVASDFLLSGLLLSYYNGTKTKRTDWQTRPVTRDDPIKILNHPVTVSLPQFGYQNTYHSNYNGSFDISTNDLIDIINEVPRISDLNSALQTKAIKIDASVYFEGEEAEESFSIYERFNSPLFQALNKKAEKLRNAQ